MPIFYDRIADQIEELLPEFYQTDGPRFISFIKAYFEFLEKGQLIYKDAADIDYIGLEDGTVAGEAFNADGQRGNMLQEPGTYRPSSITNAKINYEHDIDSGGTQKTSFTLDEYVVGSDSGAIGRIEVVGSNSNLYIEQFSEAQFDIDETITGLTSNMTAKVAQFKASPLHASNNLLSYADIDKTSGDFLEYFRRDFMPFIDRDILANKRLLQKHIKELYLAKGTKESYEFLFRILYGLEAEVTFPTENVIRPSESEFSQPTVMRLYSTSDLTKFVGGQITKYTGTTILAQAWINKSSGVTGTNDGGDGYEIHPILPYRGTFSSGDSVIISDRDGFRIDATATVRGVMADIDPDESSIYVGIEDGEAGDLEDIIRVENPTSIYILHEGIYDSDSNAILQDNQGNITYEDGIPYGGVGYSPTGVDSLTFEHALHSEDYQVRPIALETGTGVGVLLTEESVYDVEGNLITDYVLLDENTDFYDGMVTHNPEVRLLMENNEIIQLEDAYGVLLSDDSQIPDLQWVDLQPSIRNMGGGLYGELASIGSLYLESDSFNYKSPAGGTATQSFNVIGSIGRGGVTEVIIDNGGVEHAGYSTDNVPGDAAPLATRGYSTGDSLVFLNDGTDGTLAEASIEATIGNIELESGTTPGIQTFTATANQVIFQGICNEGTPLGFDPRKVEVYVEGTELTRETDFETDQTGQKVTLIGTYAVGQADALSNSDVVEVIASFRGLLLESALRPEKFDGVTQSFVPAPAYITNEESGGIKKIQITNPGVNYKTPPQVFVGGYIYYEPMPGTTSTFTAGEILTVGGGAQLILVSQDTDKKRLLVYKRTSDLLGIPTTSVTGATSAAQVTITQTNVTAGGKTGAVDGAKLYAWGDDIGSIKALKMQNVGHDFDEGGIGNYKQHAIVKSILPAGSALVAATKVTCNLTGATGTVHAWGGVKNILTLKDVKGIFNDGDYCTTDESPVKTFFIAKINPATARGKFQGLATIDGNYTNDTGFPSVTSQRIHDGQVYQDFSYIIKVGKSINDYRSIIKSLLSPAGTIFFGEVAIRSLVDARAEIYNVNFDGLATTRAFVPTLIIGSRTDVADIALEDGTVPGAIMGLNQLTLTGTGAVGVYTDIIPNIPSNPNSGFTISIQLPTTTTYSNLQITTRGTNYTQGETVTITQEMVGGTETDPSTAFATFEISETGSPLETSSHLTFTSSANPIGKVALETGADSDHAGHIGTGIIQNQGVLTTERFLSIAHPLTPAKVFKDQASGIFYSTVPDEPPGAQGLIVSGPGADYTIIPQDRDFFARYLMMEVSPKGHRVHKELAIFPAYNQHKISYTTLSNALAVGTKVRGATSGALGIVMQHDTTNKFIIVHRDQEDWGQAGSQFSGTEIIQNLVPTEDDGSTIDYFTATDIELHWTPEDIVTKREPAAITADTYITSQAQKTAAQGGAEPYTHVASGINPASTKGYHGRGKNLVVTDPSETYDSEMKQRKVTLVSSPLFTSGTGQYWVAEYIIDETDSDNILMEDGDSLASELWTQRRRTLSASNNTKIPLTQRGGRTEGTNTIVDAKTLSSPLYTGQAINVTALRLDDIKNSVSEIPGDSSVTIPLNANGAARQGVNMRGGNNWGYRPAGQKLYESTNFLSEKLIFEDEYNIIPEEIPGRIIGEYFGRDGVLLNEGNDGLVLSFSDDTVALASGTLSNGTYTAAAHTTTTGSGSGMTVTMVIASNATTSLTIVNSGQGYVVGDTVTFTNQNSQTNSLVLTIGTIEVATQMLFETETNQSDDIHYFVSEESTQIASYNLVGEDTSFFNIIFEDDGKILDETNTHNHFISELVLSLEGVRIIDETLSKPIILEEALMTGQKESNQSGPSIGDLGNIMFTENYTIMQKVQQEGNTDDIMLETGEHLIVEALSEGLRISDISTIYPNRLISNLERELGRKTNFNHSAVVQTG